MDTCMHWLCDPVSNCRYTRERQQLHQKQIHHKQQAEAGPSHTPPQLQAALPHFSEQLRARYAKYPLQHHSSPWCRKWMPHVSKEYIHPDIINKEEQEEQPDTHKEAVLRGQQWRCTEKGNGDTVQLEKLVEARSGENCECVLMEGGPGMGKSTLAWQVCHRWGRRELFDQYSTVLLLPLRDERVQQAKEVEDLFFHDKKAHKQVKRDIDNGRDTHLFWMASTNSQATSLQSDPYSLTFFLVRCSVMPPFGSLAGPLLHNSYWHVGSSEWQNTL